MKRTLAIDPGPIKSAFVLWDGERVHDFDKTGNETLLDFIRVKSFEDFVIEMVASYGMAVGKDIFETVYWIGRFCQAAGCENRIFRRDVKLHLCNSVKASDSNIVTALVDRFDPMREYGKHGKGTKKKPGPFYGFYKDIWQAMGLAVYWGDRR